MAIFFPNVPAPRPSGWQTFSCWRRGGGVLSVARRRSHYVTCYIDKNTELRHNSNHITSPMKDGEEEEEFS